MQMVPRQASAADHFAIVVPRRLYFLLRRIIEVVLKLDVLCRRVLLLHKL